MSWKIENTDVLSGLRSLAADSVHCVVTSPPYWGLRDYGVDGQIGLEKTPDEYLARMTEVFRAVRRVLRPDGTCWVNMGDGYASSQVSDSRTPEERSKSSTLGPKRDGLGGRNAAHQSVSFEPRKRELTCKPKDLIGMPWRLAFALQADGWWLRSEIIWAKRSPMPESVRDRPTKAHEQIFLLTKSARYFYDAVASAEEAAEPERERNDRIGGANGHTVRHSLGGTAQLCTSRNMRSVWTLSPEPFPEAHFATFPTELVRKCLLAGTSEKGCCPECGSFWRREVERKLVKQYECRHGGFAARGNKDGMVDMSESWSPGHNETITTGWNPGCSCGKEPIGCLVLDPFAGAGTTLMVARRMQCRAIGFELNPKYVGMAEKRIREDAPLWNVGA